MCDLICDVIILDHLLVVAYFFSTTL